MKTLHATKIVAIFTAFSLAFLQVVPAGLAMVQTKPKDLIAGTSVPNSVDALKKTPAKTRTEIPADPRMNTGGISQAIPAPIQAYVTAVQALGFNVDLGPASRTKPPKYTVKITDNKNYAIIPVGNVKTASITLYADNTGNLQIVPASITMTCYGAKGKGSSVNGQLLYEGLRQLSAQPQIAMLQVKVTNSTAASVTITYPAPENPQGYQYNIQRSKDGKVTITPVMPAAVKTHITALQDAVAGYTVTADYIKGTRPPQYQVNVTDNKNWFMAPVGPLHTMSYVLKADGTVAMKSLTTAYYSLSGDIKVDGALLYEAMGACPEGQLCKMLVTHPIDLLKKLTTTSVTKVENGAIFYTLLGKHYKAFRDPLTGKVIVIDEAWALRAKIMASIAAESAKVTAEIAALEASLAIQLKEWEANVAQLKIDLAAGRANAGTLSAAVASYLDQAGVSDALKSEIQGYLKKSGNFLDGLNTAEEQYAAFLKTGAKMTGFAISDAKAYFTALRDHEAKVAAAKMPKELALLIDLPLRTPLYPAMPPPVDDPRIALNALLAEGKLLKEKLEALPPLAVRVFSAQLNTLLNPAGVRSFNISDPALQADATYLVTVSDGKNYILNNIVAPTRGFEKMSFSVDAQGKLLPASIHASYYGVKQAADGSLLYEAMSVCPVGKVCALQVLSPIETLKKLTTISVTAVLSADVIHYALAGKYYKASRDAAAKVTVTEEPAPVLFDASQGFESLEAVIARTPMRTPILITGTGVIEGDQLVLGDIPLAWASEVTWKVGAVLNIRMVGGKPNLEMQFGGPGHCELAASGNLRTWAPIANYEIGVDGTVTLNGQIVGTNHQVTYVDLRGLPMQFYKLQHLERDFLLPNGTLVSVLELTGTELLAYVNSQPAGEARTAALAAAQEASFFYRYTSTPEGGTPSVYYEGTRQELSLAAFANGKYLSITAEAVPALSRIKIFDTENALLYEARQFSFGDNVPYFIMVDSRNTTPSPLPVALVSTFDLPSERPAGNIHFDSQGHVTAEEITHYHGDGVKSHYVETEYYPGSTALKIRKDYIYTSGIQAFLYQYAYDAAGLMTQSVESEYYPDGLTEKYRHERLFTNNYLTENHYTDKNTAGDVTRYFVEIMEKNEAGVNIRHVAKTYHPDGTTLQILDTTEYTDGTPAIRYYTVNDTSGVPIAADCSVTYVQYDWSSLPVLLTPPGTVVPPSSILRYYDANGTQLRSFHRADGLTLSMTIYGDALVTTPPATVKVYDANGTLCLTLSYNTEAESPVVSLLNAFPNELPSLEIQSASAIVEPPPVGIVKTSGSFIKGPNGQWLLEIRKEETLPPGADGRKREKITIKVYDGNDLLSTSEEYRETIPDPIRPGKTKIKGIGIKDGKPFTVDGQGGADTKGDHVKKTFLDGTIIEEWRHDDTGDLTDRKEIETMPDGSKKITDGEYEPTDNYTIPPGAIPPSAIPPEGGNDFPISQQLKHEEISWKDEFGNSLGWTLVDDYGNPQVERPVVPAGTDSRGYIFG